MKLKFLLLSMIAFTGISWGQTIWNYDFGATTGIHPINTSSTTFIPSTPTNGGTYRVRTGSQAGTIVLANPGTSLGTGTELQIQAANGGSVNKFGVYNWTNPTTTAYLKTKIRTTSQSDGLLSILLGVSTLGSGDANTTGSDNNAIASMNITYGSGAISSVNRRAAAANVTITGSGFVKDTDQELEIYANNGSSATSYVRSGTAYTLAAQTWDCWFAGTRIVNNGTTAGTLASGNLSGFAFYAQNNATAPVNSAFMYLDDLEYSNALPTQTITTSSALLNAFVYNSTGPSSEQTCTVAGSNLSDNLIVTPPSNYEISLSSGTGFVSSPSALSLTPTLGTVAATTVYVRLKSGLTVGSYSGNITAASTGATTQNIACTGEVIDAIVLDGLNNSTSLFTLAGGAYFTGNSATVDRPATTSFVSEGSHSRGFTTALNGTSQSATLETLNNISTLGYTNVALSMKLAAFSINSNSGLDGGDIVTVEVSPDGGTTYYNTLQITGNSNANWSFSATGVAAAAYDGNSTATIIAPAGGGNRTTDGYSNLNITNLPATANLKVRITLTNDATAERWLVDDFRVTGTLSVSPTLNVVAALNRFTYGNNAGPSDVQSFTVSGSSLTSDVVVTAPTNYEVSTSSTTGFGTSVMLTPISNNIATTTLYARLKIGRGIGTYNGENIVVSSGGATSVNIVCNGEVINAIAFDGFNNGSSLFDVSNTGAAVGTYFGGTTSAAAGPANAPFATEGAAGFGLSSNGTGTTTLTGKSNINILGFTDLAMSLKLAAFGSSTAAGLDGGDAATIAISPDGGITYYDTLQIIGGTNSYWPYSATGAATTAYDGDTNAITTTAGTGNQTNGGLANISITNLPRVSTLRVRITLANNSNSETWVVDDFRITGTPKATPTLSITGTPTNFIYTGNAQGPTFTVTNNSGGDQTLLYTSTDGGGYSANTPPTNAGAYQVTVSVSETDNYVAAGPSNAVAFTIGENVTMWTGATNTSWTEIGNWNPVLPSDITTVIIPNVTNKPAINTNESVRVMTIDAGAALTVNEGKTLTIVVSCINNGDLILKSSAAGTANLLSSSAVANVTQQFYLNSNQRGWRLISNPLSTINFSTLASNSTTPITLGNNASGTYMSDTNTWTDGTNADSMTSQQAFKIFLRGRTSEVTTNSYSVSPPSNVTLAIKGTATNTTPSTINTTAGQYYLVANPYTAPVSVFKILEASTGLSNTSSYYNPTIGSSGNNADLILKYGGYQTTTIAAAVAGDANDVVLPPMGAIFVQATTNGTINIPKTAIFTGPVLGGNYNFKIAQTKVASTSKLSLKINSNNAFYDAVSIYFKEEGQTGSDVDFGKLPNTILDFYSIKNNKNMAVSELDLKPQTLPLGINSTIKRSFTITVAENTIPIGFAAELVDNFLKTSTVLNTGTTYNFTIDNNSLSQGNERFSINLKAAESLSINTDELGSTIELWPNPAHDKINIKTLQFSNDVEHSIEIINSVGKIIHLTKANSNTITSIQTSGWASGLYFIKVSDNGVQTIKKLLIQ